MKNPVNHVFTGFLLSINSHSVESEGFEPSSKQAIEELSSRLVFHWVFDCRLAKDNLPAT